MSNKPKPLKEHTNQELIERARNTMVGVVMYDINQEMSNRLESADATLEKVRNMIHEAEGNLTKASCIADEWHIKVGVYTKLNKLFGVKENNDDNQN